jgi:hypothetical protein
MTKEPAKKNHKDPERSDWSTGAHWEISLLLVGTLQTDLLAHIPSQISRMHFCWSGEISLFDRLPPSSFRAILLLRFGQILSRQFAHKYTGRCSVE